MYNFKKIEWIKLLAQSHLGINWWTGNAIPGNLLIHPTCAWHYSVINLFIFYNWSFNKPQLSGFLSLPKNMQVGGLIMLTCQLVWISVWMCKCMLPGNGRVSYPEWILLPFTVLLELAPDPPPQWPGEGAYWSCMNECSILIIRGAYSHVATSKPFQLMFTSSIKNVISITLTLAWLIVPDSGC